MNIFLEEVFLELKNEDIIKLSKTIKFFYDIFISDNFWIKIGKKLNIVLNKLENNNILIIKDKIRKLNNSFPEYIISTHFYSPDKSYKIKDIYILINKFSVLYKIEKNNFCKIIYFLNEKKINTDLYQGIINQFGIENKNVNEFFFKEHLTACKEFIISEKKYLNLNLIHFQKYLVEIQWPFLIINWKTEKYNFKIQKILQDKLKKNFILKYIYISKKIISIIYFFDNKIIINTLYNNIWTENSIYMVDIEKIIFNESIFCWCIK